MPYKQGSSYRANDVLDFSDPVTVPTQEGGVEISYGPEVPLVDSAINLVPSIIKRTR